MEYNAPSVEDCVPVSNTGQRQSDPQLFWTPERRRIAKQQDKIRHIHALLADFGRIDLVEYLIDREDFDQLMNLIEMRIERGF